MKLKKSSEQEERWTEEIVRSFMISKLMMVGELYLGWLKARIVFILKND